MTALLRPTGTRVGRIEIAGQAYNPDGNGNYLVPAAAAAGLVAAFPLRVSWRPSDFAAAEEAGEFYPGQEVWSQIANRPAWRNQTNDGWVDGIGASIDGPQVESTDPGEGDHGYTRSRSVFIVFTQPIDPETITLENIRVAQHLNDANFATGMIVTGGSGGATVVELTHPDFEPETVYKFDISDAVRNAFGISLGRYQSDVGFTTNT